MKKIVYTLLISLFIVNCSFAAFFAVDPTRNIPNGRVLGLGKAYTGLADDCGAIFTNPAGLAGAQDWEMTSMSGTFLEEYQYLSFSGFYPTNYGVFGVGYGGTFIGGAFQSTIEAGSDPDDPIYTIITDNPMENRNTAIILTYANEIKNMPYLKDLSYLEGFSFGTNVKSFQASITGGNITAGSGTGTGSELDLGLTYQPRIKWMKFGAVGKNILPFSMGGKLAYASGHEESYPAALKFGSVFNILGIENSFRRLGGHELRAMIDVDMHPTISNYPMTWHLGAEWKPVEILSLRMGLDQDAGDDGNQNLGTYSDMAYGVGLDLGGFRFDYAYHTFAGAPGLTNNYFSLSYGAVAKPKPKEAIALASPSDKTVTFETTTLVAGTILDNDIRTLSINGAPIKFDLKGNFKTLVDLRIGKNAILVEGKNNRGEVIAKTRVRILRLTSFPDVPFSYWVAQPISLLAMSDIITGYPNGDFKPEGEITRAEMCTLLMKTGNKYATTSEVAALARESITFPDVPDNYWAQVYVSDAAKLRVVKGYPDGSFRPKNSITRAEGLAMISRFAKVSEEAYSNEFVDVSSRYWAARIIAGAYRAGMLGFLADGPFQPKKNLLRAETVEMLYKTRYVQDLLKKDLLDWESY